MSVATAQAIAGVSAERESEIESVYPSVASGLLGKLIGMIMGIGIAIGWAPLRVIVCVALGAVLAPLGLLAYALTKVFGSYYVITNRAILGRRMIGGATFARVPLADIHHVTITQQAGYTFHRVGDVRLEGSSGERLLVIPAIQFPERLRQVILDARNARLRSDESLKQIQSRG